MAIFRGGKRIGGFDIRVGIPRDRSLENVENDPKLRQRAGGNPETTMGRFQAFVNEAEGFARKARYYVEFYLPKGLPDPSLSPSSLDTKSGLGGVSDSLETDALRERYLSFPMQKDLLSVQNANTRRVRAFCKSISMPEREIVSKDVKIFGPARKFAFDTKSSPIQATFYADKFLRERSYFELWQSCIFSTKSNHFNFYDNYVSDVNIFQLGSYESRNERDDVTYAIKLFECYPKLISTVDYASDINEITTFSITLEFKYWINYFIDRSGNIELGSPDFGNVEVKSKYGIFGGLINKLPPELRRAGRDVLEGLKRRIPLGGITGGRVFPPFGNFPPLNI